MAESIAKLSNYRQSPRKVRLIADAVRGKHVDHALALLSSMPKRGAEPIAKLIQSAAASAQLNKGISTSDLIIEKIEVGGGLVFRRMMPRARGRGALIRKKTSHVTLALGRPANPKKKSFGMAQDK